MLVPFPPTNAGFRAQCPKPEAFSKITDATVDQVLRQEADRAVAIGIQDTYTPPIVQIDEGFMGAIYATSARILMTVRGYNPQAGADAEIMTSGERADAYFILCQEKKARPILVDSAQNLPRDSLIVSSHHSSDWWSHGRGAQHGR